MKSGEKTVKEHGKFYGVFQDLLAHLPLRSQEIVAKRFGVAEKKPLTLQAIGDEHDITRERVRQIVQSGLKSIHNAEYDEYFSVRDEVVDLVNNHHGIVSEAYVINKLGGDDHVEHGAIRFFIEGMPEIEVINTKKYPVEDRTVVISDFDVNKWHSVHNTVKNLLQDRESVHTDEEIYAHASDVHEDVSLDQIVSYLRASREIKSNPFNKWGLIEWDEISPRGVREKALLIMREKNTPMHFREIAAAIDEYGLGKRGRKSHPQTVHNELIRDNNFVLVGRGVYALNTDGYVGGTVKDVIEDVLKRSEEPLTADEVVDRVLKMRYVKPSTVKVNLNAVAKKLNKDKKYTLDTKTT